MDRDVAEAWRGYFVRRHIWHCTPEEYARQPLLERERDWACWNAERVYHERPGE